MMESSVPVWHRATGGRTTPVTHGLVVPGRARALLARRGARLAGCRVAIEGFGQVGSRWRVCWRSGARP